MSLLTKLLKKYEITVKCHNCQKINILFVPKGVPIVEFFKAEQALCQTCGCVIHANAYDNTKKYFFRKKKKREDRGENE